MVPVLVAVWQGVHVVVVDERVVTVPPGESLGGGVGRTTDQEVVLVEVWWKFTPNHWIPEEKE